MDLSPWQRPVTEYVFDPDFGVLQKITRPEGSREELTYLEPGQSGPLAGSETGLGPLAQRETLESDDTLRARVRYGYDSAGRLAWRKDESADGPVWSVRDGRNAVVEIAEETLGRRDLWTNVWAGSRLVRAKDENGRKLHLHHDRLGSVVLATRKEADTTIMDGGAAYDPCGRTVTLPDWGASDLSVPYGYAGARFDALAAPDHDADGDGVAETKRGLYLMGARWYDPEMGRFIEQDPMGEAGGANLYAYVGSSPTMWVDPTGLRARELDDVGGVEPGGPSNPMGGPCGPGGSISRPKGGKFDLGPGVNTPLGQGAAMQEADTGQGNTNSDSTGDGATKTDPKQSGHTDSITVTAKAPEEKHREGVTGGSRYSFDDDDVTGLDASEGMSPQDRARHESYRFAACGILNDNAEVVRMLLELHRRALLPESVANEIEHSGTLFLDPSTGGLWVLYQQGPPGGHMGRQAQEVILAALDYGLVAVADAHTHPSDNGPGLGDLNCAKEIAEFAAADGVAASADLQSYVVGNSGIIYNYGLANGRTQHGPTTVEALGQALAGK